MTFMNPANGYREEADTAWLWTLLFGSLYFAVKGIWSHAVVSLILAVVTAGLSWLVYPFFAAGIVRAHYLRQGWIEVSGASIEPSGCVRDDNSVVPSMFSLTCDPKGKKHE